MTQLVSQLLPSSSEKACSQIGFLPGFVCQVNRTVMSFPSDVSRAKKVPTVPKNRPMTGVSRWCGARPSSHQIAHSWECTLKERKAAALTTPSGKLRTLIKSTVVHRPIAHHEIEVGVRSL